MLRAKGEPTAFSPPLGELHHSRCIRNVPDAAAAAADARGRKILDDPLSCLLLLPTEIYVGLICDDFSFRVRVPLRLLFLNNKPIQWHTIFVCIITGNISYPFLFTMGRVQWA